MSSTQLGETLCRQVFANRLLLPGQLALAVVTLKWASCLVQGPQLGRPLEVGKPMSLISLISALSNQLRPVVAGCSTHDLLRQV